MSLAELRSRAERLGVAVDYVDVDGRRHATSPEALTAVVELLSADEPTRGHDEATRPFDDVVLIRGGRLVKGHEPRRASADPPEVRVVLEDGTDIEPIGSTDGAERLATVLEALPYGVHRLRWRGGAGEGVATVLVAPTRFPTPRRARPGLALFSPAYALWSDAEPLPSYDRLADLGQATKAHGVDTICTLPLYSPGFGGRFQPGPYSPMSRFHWNELLVPDRLMGPAVGTRVSGGATVDWDAVHERRSDQLDAVAASLDERDRAALAAFLADRPDVGDLARWASAGDPVTQRRHEVGQWLAERALDDTQRRLSENGQTLALDLPVGARADGWETRRWSDLFVEGASIGAPPDTFFDEGQNWGLPPLHPIRSALHGHRMWHELLMTAARYAGILRIDHIMQVHRLWWVPDGHAATDGAYVHYPADELLAVAAIVAERTATVMIGENLGTVPPEVEVLLADWGLIGMYEEVFLTHGGDPAQGAAEVADRPVELPTVPAQQWVGIRTHDMEPLAVTAATHDLTAYRSALAAVGGEVGADVTDLAAAMVARLRESEAFEVVVDLDDVFGATAPHNVPGTVDDGNWSRRQLLSVDRLARDPRLAAVLGSSPRHPHRAPTPEESEQRP